MLRKEIGNALLYCGDCFEILPTLQGIDALISDPPYGITDNAWDVSVDWQAFWKVAKQSCKNNAMFCLMAQGRFAIRLAMSNFKAFRYDLVWHKKIARGFLSANRKPLRAHEFVLVFCDKKMTYHPQKTINPHPKVYKKRAIGTSSNYIPHSGVTMFNENKDGMLYPTDVLDIWYEKDHGLVGNRDNDTTQIVHPTQKPIELMSWLVRTYSNEKDCVLDPFMGSGTTGVAAIRNGRHFVGIEQEEEYFEIACDRIRKASGLPVLSQKVGRKEQCTLLELAQ